MHRKWLSAAFASALIVGFLYAAQPADAHLYTTRGAEIAPNPHAYGDYRMPYRIYSNPYSQGYTKPHYTGRYSHPEFLDWPHSFDFDRDKYGFYRLRDFNDRDIKRGYISHSNQIDPTDRRYTSHPHRANYRGYVDRYDIYIRIRDFDHKPLWVEKDCCQHKDCEKHKR